MSKGWIGVDLDGTLARYDGWQGAEHIGEPIETMISRIRAMLWLGADVRIFTARVCGQDGRDIREVEKVIEAWCQKHIGRTLPITNAKDYDMIELWDDRCVQIITNTGERADGQP